MSKKDFELIAAIVATLPEPTRSFCAEAFSNRLGSTNPRFDSARFLKACNHTAPVAVANDGSV